MKILEALQTWAINQLGSTVEALNEYCVSVGKPVHTLDKDTVKVSLTMSADAVCPDGHSIEECPQAVPARPVLRVSGRTYQGQRVMADSHVGDFEFEDLLTGIVRTAGDHVTV